MLNPAIGLGVAYALLGIVTIGHLTEALQRNDWRYGTLLLLVSYGLLAFFYFKRFLDKPSQRWSDRRLSFGTASQLGFGGLAVFLGLNLVGLLGITSRFYDVFGVIGYGLFSVAAPIGMYFVMVYLVAALFFHWRPSSSMDVLQWFSRLVILAFYISLWIRG